MKRAWIMVMVVLAALGVVVLASCLRQSHEAVGWQKDLKAAMDESQKTNKPLLLDFTADWCGPCQEMRRTTWSDPQVASALKNYILVQINVDYHQNIANQFGVRGIPHLTLINPKGEVVRSSEGLLPPDEFLQWLGASRGS